MITRAIEVMAWHPEIPGSDAHAGRIDAASAPDLSLVNPDEWEWQDRARCAEVGGDPFFPELGETAEAAKRVCATCEVRVECLDFAVGNGIGFGVYGGMDERERRELGPQHLDFRPAPGREGLAA
jgi:WhiB family transcriptional regulator, redox-sensing transcriptional regulator